VTHAHQDHSPTLFSAGHDNNTQKRNTNVTHAQPKNGGQPVSSTCRQVGTRAADALQLRPRKEGKKKWPSPLTTDLA
jgi:hypothetical protein